MKNEKTASSCSEVVVPQDRALSADERVFRSGADATNLFTELQSTKYPRDTALWLVSYLRQTYWSNSAFIFQPEAQSSLEREVVEAAVKWRTVYDADSRYALDRAIDALITAREAAKKAHDAGADAAREHLKAHGFEDYSPKGVAAREADKN